VLKQCCQTALNDGDGGGDSDTLQEEEALHCIHQLGTTTIYYSDDYHDG
jgi:hypothetical protein